MPAHRAPDFKEQRLLRQSLGPRSGLEKSTGEVEAPPTRGPRFNGNNVKFCDSRLKLLFASITIKVKERLRKVYQTFKESRS